MKTVFSNARLFRDASSAMIAGVCSGVAKHFDVNPWLVRAGAIIAFTILPFAVALAYVLAILLLRYR
ncbi:PspC domain-containing protein [Glaciecola sp. SC05]|uniref:PspC domain-containing protein n=1 Tax=Glaciecola sp. SC05 TaxID=1987355 RepID=UPI00352853E0